MSEHLYDGYFTEKEQEQYRKEILSYSTPLFGVPRLDQDLVAFIENAKELVTYDESTKWREERHYVGSTGFMEELQDKTVVCISLYKHKDNDYYSLFIECEDESWIVVDIPKLFIYAKGDM